MKRWIAVWMLLLLLCGCEAQPQTEGSAAPDVAETAKPAESTETAPESEEPQGPPFLETPQFKSFSLRSEEDRFWDQEAQKRQKELELSKSIHFGLLSYVNDIHVAGDSFFYESLEEKGKGSFKRIFGSSAEDTEFFTEMKELVGTADKLLFYLDAENRLKMRDGNKNWTETDFGSFAENAAVNLNYSGFSYGDYAVLFSSLGRLVIEQTSKKVTYTPRDYEKLVYTLCDGVLLYTVAGEDGTVGLYRCALADGKSSLLAQFSAEHEPLAIECTGGKIGLLTACGTGYGVALYSVEATSGKTLLLHTFEAANGRYSSCGLWSGVAYLSARKDARNYSFVKVDYQHGKVISEEERDVSFVYATQHGLLYNDEDDCLVHYLNRMEDVKLERPISFELNQAIMGEKGLMLSDFAHLAWKDGKWQ